MQRTFLKTLGFLVAAFASTHAMAVPDWTDQPGHITEIEVSAMGSPGTGTDLGASLTFKLDAAVGSGSGCAAGDTLFWVALPFTVGTSPVPNDKQMENERAVLTTLLLAIGSGNKVKLSGMNKASGVCQVTNVKITNTY